MSPFGSSLRPRRPLVFGCFAPELFGSSLALAMASLPPAKISAALRRWQRDGVAIDPKSEAHIAAYRLARQTHDRPRADQVLAIIESQRVQHKSAANLTSDFWLVPRCNFPDGLPADLKKWSMSEAELRKSFQVPKDTDFGQSFILDGGCARQGLGRGVKSMGFSETLLRVQSSAASAACAPGDGGADDDSATEDPAPMVADATEHKDSAASSAAAPSMPAAANDRAGSAALALVETAAVAPVAAAPAVVGPPSKRARVLKLMGSEDGTAAEEVFLFSFRAQALKHHFWFLLLNTFVGGGPELGALAGEGQVCRQDWPDAQLRHRI